MRSSRRGRVQNRPSPAADRPPHAGSRVVLSLEPLEPRIMLDGAEPWELDAPVIDVGGHTLLANAAGQEIEIFASGAAMVSGMNVRAQLGDGLGPDAEPVFDDVDFTGGIWDSYGHTVTGGPVSGAEQFLQAGVVFNQSGHEVAAGGLAMRLSVDTTGFTSGHFPLLLEGTEIGADTAFILSGGVELVAEAADGSITISEDDVYEPNDQSADATVLALGMSQAHKIEPAGDVDWFTFTLAEERFVTLATSGASGDTRLWLYDGDLAEIAFNDDRGEDLFSRVQERLPSGTYYAKVDEYGGNDTIAAYTITLEVSETAGPLDAYEPDDEWDQATRLEPGVPQQHSIGPAGDEDWFTFSLDEDQLVVLETSEAQGDTRLWLYDENLAEVAYNDDGGEGLLSRIDRPLSSGTYYVKVDEFGDNDAIASYTLSLTAEPVPPPPGCLEVEILLYEDLGGVPGGPIANDTVEEGQTFFVEIVAGDIREAPAGIVGLDLDVGWDPYVLEEIDLPFDPADPTSLLVTSSFPVSRGGVLDNTSGWIDELRGSSQPADGTGAAIGSGALEPYSLMLFRADQRTVGAMPFTIALGDAGVSFADDADAVVDIESQYLRVTAPGMSDVGEIHGRVWHDVDADGVFAPGEQADAGSGAPSLSSDGRYVAFESSAANLVPGDANGHSDIFVHDRETGQTTRVSVSTSGAEAGGSSDTPAISADGRYVAFVSQASNLVPGDTNGRPDVFVHDRDTGETTRVSVSSMGVEGDGWCYEPSIDGEGRYVAFTSSSSNLVPDDINGAEDVFVHDRELGETVRVSVSSTGEEGDGWSYLPSISGDGRYVAFTSDSSNLVAGDTNLAQDVFVHDCETGETVRVSVSSAGEEGDGSSYWPSISSNGRYVAFGSGARNLIAGDTTWAEDIFVHDRETGETTRVSVSSEGDEANGSSGEPAISGDGRYVAFRSSASNLAPGDTNGLDDVFVHDRETGTTTPAKENTDGEESTVTLDTSSSGGFGDTEMWLYDDSLTELAYNDDWDGLFSHIETSLPNGAYYVKVEGYGGFVTVDAYTMSLDVVQEPEEAGDTWDQAATLTPGVPQDHSIDPASDEDWFTFALDREAIAILETSGASGDSRMWLYDGSLTQVAFNDDGGGGLFSRIEVPLSAGTYYVQVDEFGGNDTIEAYTISLQIEYEPSDTWDQAVPLSVDVSQQAKIDPAGDEDRFTFTLDREAIAILETSGASGDSRMWLYDESLTQVAFNDDGGGGLFSRIEVPLSAGTYYVQVDEFGGNDTIEAYTISLQIEYEPNDTWDQAAPLAPGAPQPARIDPSGDEDWFTFTLGDGLNGESYAPSISTDGRHLAFASDAGNLVADDTNESSDIFVADRWADEIARASLSSTEPPLAGWTVYLDVNENGRLDPDDYSTTTDESGAYRLASIPGGTYRVVDVPSPGWTQTSPGSLSFDDATDYQVAGQGRPDPSAVAIGDLNGDGDLDLAVGNAAIDAVSVLNSEGDDTFALPVLHATAGAVSSLALGDLNGDALLDIAAASHDSDRVSVLLGNGDGTFAPATHIDVGHNPSAIVAGDLDGDGDLDLVVANHGSDDVQILLNGGDATFTEGDRHLVGNQPQSLALTDIDGDGSLDIAVANNGAANVCVLLNRGSGTFTPGSNLEVGSGPNAVCAADLNGDGHTDLAVANTRANTVTLLIGQGDGTFAPGLDLPVGDEPTSLAAADLDGDQDVDLAVAHSGSNDVQILENGGNGAFVCVQTLGVDNALSAMAAGDLDGDGDTDLVVTQDETAEVSVLLNRFGARGHAVTVEVGDVVTQVDFGNAPLPGEIHGSMWHDLNQDGAWDDGEPALAGWTVYLDLNENAQLDGDDLEDETGANGEFSFVGLQTGRYTLAVDLPLYWEQTHPSDPAVHTIDLGSGQSVRGMDFGNWEVPIDEDEYEPNDTWTQPTTLGVESVQLHSIDTPGDVDWFTFTLEDHSFIDVRASDAVTSGHVEMCLYDDGLSEIMRGDRSPGETYIAPYDPLSSGTYFLTVSESGRDETVREYHLSMATEPPEPKAYGLSLSLGGDAGDSWLEATLLESGTEQVYSIDSWEDEDWFTFTLDETSVVSLETWSDSGSIETWFYDQSLTELDYGDEWFEMEATLPEGVYYVQVVGVDDTVDEYSVWLYVSSALGTSDAWEPDDTPDQATALALGTPQNHSIAPLGDEDWFTFTLEEPLAITLETSGSGGDTEMWLYDGDLAELAYNDDWDGLFSHIEMSLPDGIYYVKVAGFDGTETVAAYAISLDVTSADGTSSFGEPNDTWDQALALSPAWTQYHEFDPIGDVDWFTFTLDQPSTVTLATSGDSPWTWLDTEMWLYDENLTELAYNDDWEWEFTSRIETSLLDGVYYVKVSEWGARPPDPYEPDDTRDLATPLVAGVPQDHTIGPYLNRDWYDFTLEEETFVVLEVGGETEIGMWLYGDNLSPVASAQAAWDEEVSLSRLLPPGSYHVKIRALYGEWGDEIAPYTIGLRTPESVGTGEQVHHGLLDGTRRPLFSEGRGSARPTLTDIDGDGDLDLFLSTFIAAPLLGLEGGDSRVWFFRNDGNARTPSWTLMTDEYLTPQRGEGEPFFVDIDGDEDLDLFLANSQLDTMGRGMTGSLSNISFYRNDASEEDASEGNSGAPEWTFVTGAYLDTALGSEWTSYSDFGVTSPTFVDIDRDKDLDLFFIGSGTVWHLRNDGTSERPLWTFVTDGYVDTLSDISASPTGIAFADIDTDEDLDLFVGTDRGDLCFYRNNGTSAPLPWTFVTDHYASIEAIGECVPAFGDIDGDQDLDLLLGDAEGRVGLFRNDGNAQVAAWTLVTDNYLSIDVGDRSVPSFADIDGDGDMDMFTGEEDGSVGLYRNEGHAQLASWSEATQSGIPIDTGSSSIPAFADIDADGDLDLFIGEEQGNLSFYLNDGTADEPVWVFVENGYAGIDVGSNAAPAFADLDADGDLDLFVGCFRGTIWFYQNGGSPESPDWVLMAEQYEGIDVGEMAAPWFEDIDGDDLLDLFVGGRDGGVSFYRNEGDAQTPLWVHVADDYVTPDAGWDGATVPTFTDIDDDGDPDLFVGEATGDVHFFENEGKPPFSWILEEPGYGPPFVGWDSAPALADIDGDNDLDLFVGNGDGTITFFRNEGPPQDPLWILTEEEYANAYVPWDAVPAFADIDGDADLDLFVGGGDGQIWFYPNEGTRQLPVWNPGSEQIVEDELGPIWAGSHTAPSFADIDGDADYDLFVADWDGNFRFYRNDGDPQSPRWTLVTDQYVSMYMSWGSPAFADIDSDGDVDLFTVDWDGNLQFRRNDGDAWAASWDLTPAAYPLDTPAWDGVPTFGDVDDDGDLDLLMGDFTGLVSFYRNDPQQALPIWTPVTSNFVPTGTALNTAPAFADIDADGDPDLFVGEDTGRVSFFRNEGLQESLAWAIADTQYASIVVDWAAAPTFTDIDDDGDFDLFVGEESGSISFYRNDGDAQEPSWQLVPDAYASAAVDSYAIPAFVDIDDDGVLDLFVGDGDGKVSRYEYEDGEWSSVAGSHTSIDVDWGAAPAFADIDRDGDFDLFVGDGNGHISFYQNSGDAREPSWRLVTSTYASVAVDSYCTPAFADVDDDGDLDLFVGSEDGCVSFVRNDDNGAGPVWTFVTDNFTGESVGWYSVPTLVDIDDDGLLDLVVGEDAGSIFLFTRQLVADALSFELVDREYSGINAVKASAPTFVDIDGDRDLDLFVGQENGRIAFCQNDPHDGVPVWTFITDSYADIDVGAYSAPTFGDLDGDGDPDLLVGGEGGTISLYLNDPDAQPTGWTLVAQGLLEGSDYGSVPALADFDSDGDLDLFVGNRDGHLRFYRNDGWDGAALLEAPLETDWFAGIHLPWGCAPAPVDIDGDADLDLFVGDGQGGLTFWRNAAPKLEVAPGSATVLTEGPLALTIRDDAGQLSWSFRDGWDRSGGTIDEEGHYVAGDVGGVVDCIEVESADGLIGRAYINVVSAEDVSTAGKAIVVAGRRTDDYIWSATDHMADFAYSALRYRGFSAENICYLSPGTGPGVDGAATLENLAEAFEWARGANALTVYLVDHGGSDPKGNAQFRLNPSEILTGPELDAWLDAWQTDGRWATVVIDACQSGSFLDELQPLPGSNRIVIGSTTIDDPSYFVADGVISFSDVFWSSIYAGSTVMGAFDAAADSMSYFQSAQLDDDGDGVYTGQDGQFASTCYIGASYIGGADRPEIGAVSGNVTLDSDSGTEAPIWADGVSGVYPVTRVWAVVVPPSFKADPRNPVVDLPEITFLHNERTGRWEGSYDGFTESGTYAVVIHAQDIWNSLSIPKQTFVTQGEFDERTILVAGSGAFSDTAPWEATEYLASYAYQTLRSRMFDDDRIYYLHPDTGLAEVDDQPAIETIEEAIAWAGEADKLNLYFVGRGEPDGFRLNDDDVLSPAVLDTLLDDYQDTHDQPVTVIFDASYSGGWIGDLTPPDGSERVVIASAPAVEQALCSTDGRASFTQFFMNQVFMGRTVREAFANTLEATGFTMGQTQAPTDPGLAPWGMHQLDDNGNGQPSERLTEDGRPGDGEVARYLHLGSAFVTGTDLPVIGDTSGGAIFSWDGPALLWASNVTDADGIERVWATVVPPSYDPDAGDTITTVDLLYSLQTDRYEGVFEDFVEGDGYAHSLLSGDQWSMTVTVPRADGSYVDIFRLDFDLRTGRYTTVLEASIRQGAYSVSFYAEDMQGNVVAYRPDGSREVTGPDAPPIDEGTYEDNDSEAHARPISVEDGPQEHDFHDPGDVDWATFYALQGKTYVIETGNLGENCDTVVELYDEDIDRLVWRDSWWAEDYARISWECEESGVYYIKVAHLDSSAFGPGTEYELGVYTPEAFPQPIVVTGKVRSPSQGNGGVSGVNVLAVAGGDVHGSDVTRPDGTYRLVLTAGTYRLTVSSDTYRANSTPSVRANPHAASLTQNLSVTPVGTGPANMHVTHDGVTDLDADLAFGGVWVGVQPQSYTVTVQNRGFEDLTDLETTLSDDTNYSVAWDRDGVPPDVIRPGRSRTATITFDPTTEHDFPATFLIESDGSDGQQVELSLSGTGLSPGTQVLTAAHSVASFHDLDGDLVTVRLYGAGEVRFRRDVTDPDERADIETVELVDTDASTVVRIEVHDIGDTPGDGTSVGSITGSEAGEIYMPDADLVGNTIDLTGALSSLIVRDIVDGSDILLDGEATDRLTLYAREVGDVDLEFAGVLTRLDVGSWADGEIAAHYLGELYARDGDFGADVTLVAADDAGWSLLGAEVAGDLTAATWDLPGGAAHLRVDGDVDADIDVAGDLGRLYSLRRGGRRRWYTDGFWCGGDLRGAMTVAGTAWQIDVDGQLTAPLTIAGNAQSIVLDGGASANGDVTVGLNLAHFEAGGQTFAADLSAGSIDAAYLNSTNGLEGTIAAAQQVDVNRDGDTDDAADTAGNTGSITRLHVQNGTAAGSAVTVEGDLGGLEAYRRGGRRRWRTVGFWSGGDVSGALDIAGTAWLIDVDGQLDAALTIGANADGIFLDGGTSTNGDVTVGLALTYLDAAGQTFAGSLSAGSVGTAYINSTDGLEGTIAVTQQVDVNRDGDTDDAIDTAGNTGSVTRLHVLNGTAAGSSITIEGDLGGPERYRRGGRWRWRTVGFWSGGDVNGALDVAGHAHLIEIAPGGELGAALRAGSMQDVSLLGGMAGTGRIQTLRTADANGDLITTGDVATLRLGEDVEGDLEIGGHLETLEIGYRTGRRGRFLNDATFTGTLEAGSIGNAYCHATAGLGGTVEVVRRDINNDGDRDDDVDTTGNVGGFYVYGGPLAAAVHIEGSVTELQAHQGTTAAGTLTVDGDLGGLRLVRRGGRRRWVSVGFWSGGDVMADITVSGTASLIDIHGDLVEASINPNAATAGELETVTVAGQIRAATPQWVRAAVGTFYLSDSTWSGYITATTPDPLPGPVTAQIG